MEKTKKGFLLPNELIVEFEAVASRLSGKEKWVVFAASFLLFLEAGTEKQNDYMNRVRMAESPGRSIKPLLEAAKAGGLKLAVITGTEAKITTKATGSRGSGSSRKGLREPKPGPDRKYDLEDDE